MPAAVEQPIDEAKQLRACINDLIGIVALPAIWSGAGPADIARTLTDTLLGVLDLDVVYLRLKQAVGEPPLQIVSTADSRAMDLLPKELKQGWAESPPHEWPQFAQYTFGDKSLSIVPLPLGIGGEMGTLIAGSSRADFPQQTERLLLSVATNQAVVGLQGARLLSEQQHLAEELDRMVTERTEELTALKARLEIENIYLQDEIRKEHNFDEILGNSPQLLKLLGRLQAAAPTEANVLIIGETGCGKELIARAIHGRSVRKNSPLVKVNCGAIPTGLVESELFGHLKGAFTSASERRIGRFELANNGTLFLDEVGELPLETQVKLLRVLQEQEFEPVGSNRTVKVNVRIIAATNRDLEKAVQSGAFRSDLYYRLNVIPLRVPALRERRSDIPLLVTAFLNQYAKRMRKPIDSVSRETMKLLQDYSWPGNIRELQNVIERGVVLSHGSILKLGADLLPLEASETRVESSPAAARTAGDSLEEVQRQHILQVLAKTDWVISGPRGAGAILDIHPNTLRSLMNRLGIRREPHAAS